MTKEERSILLFFDDVSKLSKCVQFSILYAKYRQLLHKTRHLNEWRQEVPPYAGKLTLIYSWESIYV